MSVTTIERTCRRASACFGLLGALFVWVVAPAPIDRDEAVQFAQPYLDATAEFASLSLDGRTWTVTADDEHAIVDAQTGELIEIEF